MKVYRTLDEINIDYDTAVALGNFDGVHLGHLEIIKAAVIMAKKMGLTPACFTFSNHPRDVFKCDTDNEEGIKFIACDEEKIELLDKLGIEVVFDVPFDEVTMKMAPEKFISDILYGKLNAKGLCCGFNFNFGAKAKGDEGLLRALSSKYGYITEVIRPVKIDGELVSSTAIRIAISSGEIEKANSFLGRAFSITGVVKHGNHIGTKIGFPTANIAVTKKKVAPANGVYFTNTIVDGKRYKSVTSVGTKPTIGNYDKAIETNIFGIDYDLYGKTIIVEFLKFHRPELKFDSIETLTAEIAKDIESARRFHEGK